MRGSRRRLGVAVVAGIALQIALIVGAAAGPAGTPPPTPVPPDGSLSPFPTVLHTPRTAAEEPSIEAASVVLADLDSGQVLLSKNPGQHRAIASLTKIMTALLVSERSHPSEAVTVTADAQIPEDRRGLSELGLREGERLPVRDLLYALILQSANDAAIALADHVAGSQGRFVAMMNSRARRLGMLDTHFRSPNGLDDRGYSSAADLVKLTRTAYASSPLFGKIATTRYYEIPTPEGPARQIQNRNVLLWLYPGTIGVKTGYTSRAGYCVVAAAERDGRRLVAVVLGSSEEPFSQAASLLNYGFAAFTEATFVDPGEDMGQVSIVGGAVRVKTAVGLQALVRSDEVDEATRTIVVDPEAAFPPAPGEEVGQLRVAVGDRVLGQVPLVASSVPGPPTLQEEGPWWRRAASSVARAASGAVDAAFG